MSDMLFMIYAIVSGGIIIIFSVYMIIKELKIGSIDDSTMSAMMVSIMANQQQNQTATESAAATVDAATASVYTPDPPTYTPDPSSYSAPTCTPSDTSSCA